MKKSIEIFLFLFTVIISFMVFNNFSYDRLKLLNQKSELGSKDNPIARAEYEFRMLANPTTGVIPQNIRQHEIEFIKSISTTKEEILSKGLDTEALTFTSRGPVNRGGRVRALAFDVRSTASNSVIIAGGVSGGIWRSTDKGGTWTQTSLPSQINSTTCIAQDIRSGHQDTWYVGTGEAYGGSARGGSASYLGDGIFKSTDNGLSWARISGTVSNTPQSFDQAFDFVHNIAINPTTGTIFAAAINTIAKSTDGGNNWSYVRSSPANASFTDVIATANGTIYATVNSNVSDAGIWKSTNDGASWTEITPSDFPGVYNRVVISAAPSNQNIIYLLANTPGTGKEGHGFWASLNGGSSWSNYTNNLPDTEGDVAGYSSQGSYDMVIAVKPDDPKFVIFGGTNLHRSTDGMKTKLANTYKNWIGGYSVANDISSYPTHHPDQHAIAFAPYNSNIVYSGNDGGIQLSSDITRGTVVWEDKNNGFITSQFYSISMDQTATNDPILLGGLQDNGNYFVNSTSATAPWVQMIAGGDGAITAIANEKSYYYIETQNGSLIRLQLNSVGNYTSWTLAKPTISANYLFSNPYVLDPNNSNIMYFCAGDSLRRNSDLSAIPNFSNDPTSVNWSVLSNTRTGNIITAVSASKTPANIVYYGTADGQIYRLNNANVGNPSPTNLWSGKGMPNGYVSSLAIDPNNANNVLAVFSNYEVISLYYTSNGGTNWTAVAGNIEENTDGSGSGPSCRWASITNYGDAPTYFVATSAGLYSTSSLNGMSTIWTHESPNEIGVSVCTMVKTRETDGNVVVATHGSGVYSAKIGSTSSGPKATTDTELLTLTTRPGQNGSTSFVLTNSGDQNLEYSVAVTGDLLGKAFVENHLTLTKINTDKNLFDKNRINNVNGSLSSVKSSVPSNIKTILGDDILYLDDGDDVADNFLGFGSSSDFYWYNEFNLNGFSFQLDEFYFYMRTENAASNSLDVTVYNQNGDALAGGTLEYTTSTDGAWYSAQVNPALDFSDGETFYIEIGTNGSGVNYPAGTDTDASVPNKSYYYDGSKYVNINTMSGFENAAFLIRATGTILGQENQTPVAVANVTPTQASPNETISFDASGSYDNDGQITGYLWNFGDGATSTSATVQHSYTSENTYNYSLTVTDNGGATNQASGQIVISTSSDPRVIVSPSSGTISAGMSQTITITLDASSVSEGTYSGQVNVTSNGGNLTIPIDYVVNVKTEIEIPTEYSLSQNYPNPFNPTTTINYSIKNSGLVSLNVYNIKGELVSELVNKAQSVGNYSVNFDASKLSSGTYIYELKNNENRIAKKMLLLK